MKKLRLIWPDIAIATVLCLLALVYFVPLLWPEMKLLVTPDFGRSDSWHYSFQSKFMLWQSLQSNRLPLWEPRIGMGFPLFAEGPVGALFIPNMLLFKFLPNPVLAYNVSFMVTFAWFGVGMYLWLRYLGCTRPTSLFGACTAMASGIVIPRLTQYTVVQSISMMPWIFLATHAVVRKPRITSSTLLALAVSQQIMIGFPQITFITIVFSFGYFLFLIKHSTPRPLRSLAYLSLSYIGALGLSAVQLVPSYEFLQATAARGGFPPETASYFSYPWKHLKTLFSPFALGNPRLGTYPPFSTFDGSIFWENTGYIGLAPIALAVFGVVFLLKKTSLRPLQLFFWGATLVSLLLMTGKYSPLYLIYSLWPFNLFRVPSRFLTIFVLSLIVQACLTTTAIEHKFSRSRLVSSMILIILSANLLLLGKSWQDYHAFVPAAAWLSPPPTIAAISPKDRVLTIGAEASHNSIFLKEGWKTIEPYAFLRNTLSPNTNVYWNIYQKDVYTARTLERTALFDTLLSHGMHIEANIATISAKTEKYLTILGVNILISTVPLNSPGLVKTADITQGQTTITRFRNEDALPRAYIATQPIVATSLAKARSAFEDISFIPGTSVLTHLPLLLPTQPAVPTKKAHVTVTDPSPDQVTVDVGDNPTDGVLVLTDAYYPGWQATLDGSRTPVYAVNIRQRGVLVPKGSHQILFFYRPQSFMLGLLVTLVTIAIIGVLWGFPLIALFFHIGKTAHWP
ncbi:hypothetical protein A2973_03045 [Candidatus Gottesmanbacteria bacterium RIFCSPLOWO2_01_FULL_49_10]|uniref:Membrane protein 6-pyruvoyl-tetrahydropterin synthase-related domain-containing protein n=1 Tax=Candidatus Gottesmanbacteria bacterium RIFCSPLOWO2_01_FULL_49_10 TaxID=1798396 RepID=A0A1F6B1W8_9BACT|nr:MAG: hypothetical protein A2973_03045 [Candidatus Gottesmanbacteria bacterium RIFCSPLOWO2_01_FULL_49_10]